jgi:hypothetical protein
MRLWAVQQALILMYTRLARFPDQVQACLVGVALVYPLPLISAAALASRVWANTSIAPFVWESHLWCTHALPHCRCARCGCRADASAPPCPARGLTHHD